MGRNSCRLFMSPARPAAARADGEALGGRREKTKAPGLQ
jgi:hypothetical protein